MFLRYRGDVFYVYDYYEAKTAQRKGVLHVRLKNVRTQQTLEVAADMLGKIESVDYGHRPMQYLYARGQEHVFMDQQTFDQVSLTADQIKNELPFLVPEKDYKVFFLGEQPVMLELPPVVTLKVTDTAPPQHSVGQSNVLKDAKVESGLTVKVPLFIKSGDVVRVDIATREYLGKE
jgi:elongation factor P